MGQAAGAARRQNGGSSSILGHRLGAEGRGFPGDNGNRRWCLRKYGLVKNHDLGWRTNGRTGVIGYLDRVGAFSGKMGLELEQAFHRLGDGLAVAVPLVGDRTEAVRVGKRVGDGQGLPDLRRSAYGDGTGSRLMVPAATLNCVINLSSCYE